MPRNQLFQTTMITGNDSSLSNNLIKTADTARFGTRKQRQLLSKTESQFDKNREALMSIIKNSQSRKSRLPR